MSIISDKKNVFNSINSIKSFSENNRDIKLNNSLSSISNKNDSLGFLLDIATVLMGGYGLYKILGTIFGSTYEKATPILNNQLKNSTLSPQSNKKIINTNFDEIEIPVKDIDINNKLRTDPNNDIGKLLYGENETDTFDYKLYDTINNPNTPKTINNIIVEYNDSNDSLIIKPLDNQQVLDDFYSDYIYNNDSTNKNEFVTNVLNDLFGIKDSTLNNKNEIINNLKTKNKIEKIIFDEEVELDDEDINNIEEKSDLLKKGYVNYDWGCGVYKTQLTIETTNNFIDNINNNPDSNSISNEIEDLFNKTYQSDNNVDSAKDKFNKDLMNGFQIEMVNSFILTPKSIILNNIISKVNKNTLNDDYVLNNKKTIKCLSDNVKNEINSEIFNIVKSEMNDLIKPFAKRIIREKITQYTGILKSLTGFS